MNASPRRAGRSSFGDATPLLLLLGLLGLAGQAGAAPNTILPADLPPASAVARSEMEMDRPEEREVLVPTGFEAWRTPKDLVVKEFTGLKSVKLTVGKGRMVVATSKLYIYPAGEPRPAQPLGESLYGYPPTGGMGRPTVDGFLQPGKPYIVELEIFMIEIHEPSGHLLIPGGGKDKVIWQKTFRQIPKEMPRLPEKIRKAMDGPPDHATLPPLPPQK